MIRHSMRRRGETRRLGPMKVRKVRKVRTCDHPEDFVRVTPYYAECELCGSRYSKLQAMAREPWKPRIW